MRLLFFLLLVLGVFTNITAQPKTNLHIITASRNHLPAFPNFHFQVNGQSYKLKAGKCLDISLNTDSIHIEVEDKRWIKNDTNSLQLVAEKDIYVWVRVDWKGNFRDPRYGAVVLSPAEYGEFKNKCK